MVGWACECGGAGISSLSTQDLRDLFEIFSRAVQVYSSDRDAQIGTLYAIRDELKKRRD